MKLKKFIENINSLTEEIPEALELEVVFSRDDEGNDYGHVYFEPSLGVLDSGEFTPYGGDGPFLEECEHICIN